MDDDDNDNSGGFDDDTPDDQGDDQEEEEEEEEDESPGDDDTPDGQGGGGADDQGGGDDLGDDLDDQFASEDDLVGLDPAVYADAGDFANADETDFADDDGGWGASDYDASAERLFGDHEFFGDTLATQLGDSGFQPYQDARFAQEFDRIAPGTSNTLHLFERDGRLWAFGFVPLAVLELLRARYSGLDLSNLEVASPFFGERVEPRPLPPAYARIQPADAVDLRHYATPVGDQRQTARCSAFAWTHGLELTRNVMNDNLGQPAPAVRLSPNYTMLQFQRMQGDARDYTYAYQGGQGTVSGPDPGAVLAQNGTCRQDYWPDDRPRPLAADETLAADAEQHRLEGAPVPIALEDVKKVLSGGCPVHLAMNTGPQFSEVGRDGIVRVAEDPSGMHGRHAMLITGYAGNFFTVKNSWGTDWGDQGYCYIPKAVLAESDPEFVAILLRRP